ncbi:gallidermin/nisin family lantibiotic [Kocuria marina]|uniref:gallidermin/nisin family lantibiotic n=1 Tax=Kocuria marina TaxID=223184 RepID=UPI0034607621
MTATLEAEKVMDIDLEIDIDAMPTDADAQPMITSISLCTPGCTSPGGGSQCSWCC